MGNTDVHCLLVLLLAGIASPIRDSWFSSYGLPGYGRQSSEGLDHGEMSRFQCSMYCGRNDNCKAIQFDPTTEGSPLGRCIVFSSYTFEKKMVQKAGCLYYEKRTCPLLFNVDAVTLHRDDYHCSMYSDKWVKVYKFNVVNNMITGPTRVGTYPISDVYPGYTDTVDAIFEMVGISPLRTILIRGTTETCYERDTGRPDALAFNPCGNTNYLGTFFSQKGITRIDAVTMYDTDSQDVHVFANDVVYHLRYDGVLGEFVFKQEHDQLLQSTANPWSNTFRGFTGVMRLSSRSFYLFEGPKYIKYDTITKSKTLGPSLVCFN